MMILLNLLRVEKSRAAVRKLLIYQIFRYFKKSQSQGLEKGQTGKAGLMPTCQQYCKYRKFANIQPYAVLFILQSLITWWLAVPCHPSSLAAGFCLLVSIPKVLEHVRTLHSKSQIFVFKVFDSIQSIQCVIVENLKKCCKGLLLGDDSLMTQL